MKKPTILRFILVWFICFVALFVAVNGVGIFGYEKKQCDISELIGDVDSITAQQWGWQYVPQDEKDCLLFDFSNIQGRDVVYGVELTLHKNAVLGNLAAYYDEKTQEHENWQNVVIEQRQNKLIMLFTKSNGQMKLYTDKTLEIVSSSVITKGNITVRYILLCIIALGISVLYVFFRKDSAFRTAKWTKVWDFIADKKVMATVAVILAECLVIGLAETVHYLLIHGAHWNPCRVWMLGCMAAFLIVVFRHREGIARNFYVFYFFLVVATGTVYIVGCAPYSLDLSWDDQTHYARANYVARGFRSYETEAGYQLKNHYFDRGTNEENFTKEKRMELAQYIDSIDKNKDYGGLWYVDSFYSRTAAVSYVPAAIGLIIGRGLKWPTMASLLLGRWTNLIFYALVLSYAVYLLQERGYIIAALIGMIPPAVFLASNYSYDWWVTSLSILGFAMFDNVIQGENKTSYLSVFKVMIVMFLAILPKAVYLTLVIPIMAVFAAKGGKNKKGLLIAAAIMVLLAASFMVPLISSMGAFYNDIRGGTDVNAVEQIQFILTRPIQYFMILARFLWRFINPDKSVEAFGYYILFGTGKFYSVVLILLVLGCFVDNRHYRAEEQNRVKTLRLWSAVGMLITLALIATALYISFTPVMSNTINGVQARYIMPLLFPLLFYVFRIDVEIPQRIKDSVAIYGTMIMAFILCFNIYVQCICFY